MGFTGKLLIVCVVLLSISVGLGVISFFPVPNGESKSSIIINDRFNLTFQEIYRQGIGAFHGGENITILISQNSENLINFTLLTYGGPQYSEASRTDIAYVFVANQDYYEAVFCTNITEKTLPISLQVTVQKPDASFPFSGLSDFAKTLFIISLTIGTIYFVKSPRNLFDFNSEESKPTRYTAKNLKLLKYSILLSLIFWLLLLIINTYQLATFENWYTDSARHPYTSVLFTKVGFSVFDTPLKALSSSDNSKCLISILWAAYSYSFPSE
jgi:hypothetical protein